VNLVFPVLYLIVAAFLLIFPWFVSPVEAAIGVCMVLSGIPVYWIGVCWKKPKFFQQMLSKYKSLHMYYMCRVTEDRLVDLMITVLD
jgi:hypothetical protein